MKEGEVKEAKQKARRFEYSTDFKTVRIRESEDRSQSFGEVAMTVEEAVELAKFILKTHPDSW